MAIIKIVFELLLGVVYCVTVGSVAMAVITVVGLVAVPCEIFLQIAECFERRPAPH